MLLATCGLSLPFGLCLRASKRYSLGVFPVELFAVRQSEIYRYGFEEGNRCCCRWRKWAYWPSVKGLRSLPFLPFGALHYSWQDFWCSGGAPVSWLDGPGFESRSGPSRHCIVPLSREFPVGKNEGQLCAAATTDTFPRFTSPEQRNPKRQLLSDWVLKK